MIIKFILKNYSSIFGGQERFAQSIISELLKKGEFVEFEGGPVSLFNLTKRGRSFKFDHLVTIFNGNAAIYKTIFQRKKDAVWVYVHHSDINDAQQSSWKRWVRKILIYLLLKRFDLVIRVCNMSLPDAYARGKIKTIYNGVYLPEKNKCSHAKESCSSSVFRLLMVGSINDNKNQKMAIESLSLLEDVELVVLGSGSHELELKNFASEIGVAERIKWIGFIDDLEPYYLTADVLLMLSHFEAFPYAVLEAMSYGLPVVSVPVGGVPEILTNLQNGWMLKDYNVEGLARTINDIKAAPDKYADVSAAARKTIQDGYTVDHMTQHLLSAIKEKIRV